MFGEILEWAGGFLAALAAYIYAGWALGIAIAAVFLIYEAQCLAGVEFHPPRRTEEEPTGPPEYVQVLDDYDIPVTVRTEDAEAAAADFAARKFARGRVSG